MGKWIDLPGETRITILDLLAAGIRDKDKSGHPRALYASVCREWQAFFENINFRHLILSSDCVFDIDKVVNPHRIHLLRHLWLRIELPRYTCMSCPRPTKREPVSKFGETFNKALRNLFTVLSRWNSSGSSGITLELGVYSPSDSEHFFRNHSYDTFKWTGEECLDDGDDSRRFLARRPVQDDDDVHGWRRGRQSRTSRLSLILAKEERDSAPLDITRELPKVKIITGFLIRRQYPRRISTPALCHLFQSLPRLEHINYEVWRDGRDSLQKIVDSGDCLVFNFWLPMSLKQLVIFEDFHGMIHKSPGDVRPTSHDLGLALAKASRRFESLSLAFVVDARDFFGAFRPDTWQPSSALSPESRWENLTTLALTSRRLRIDRGEERANDLLQAAGHAALGMPKLEVLEIWNAQKGEAGVFRYERAQAREACGRVRDYLTVVAWCGSWDLHLQSRVVDIWTRVALNHTQRELVVQYDRVAAPENSYGSFLACLRLRRLILHPVSLYQIQWEADNPQV